MNTVDAGLPDDDILRLAESMGLEVLARAFPLEFRRARLSAGRFRDQVATDLAIDDEPAHVFRAAAGQV